MLLSTKHLFGFKVEASDGEIGRVHNVLIDDRTWIVRYIVVDTGGWLSGRKVLLSPSSAGNPDGEAKSMPIHLTRNQIENSPEINTDMPVSRKHELKLHQYYEWKPYWIGGFYPTGPAYVSTLAASESEREKISADEESEDSDPHLRSTREVIDYKIHAVDGEIGHVEDFIVSVRDWIIRYIIVDTKNWLPGKKVIISPDWIKAISWADSSVTALMTKSEIEGSPEYDPTLPINMEYEARLYDYYGRPKYWE